MRELQLSKTDIRFARWLVLINGAIPIALLGLDAINGKLGANPTNFALRSTGFLALIFLIASLIITPARSITGQGWLVHFRRSLGLYAFFHAAIHFGIFFWFDREAKVGSTLSEMWLRKYLLVGAVSLIVMVPLAVTSTNGMIARLGPKRWKQLHRLAYVAAIAGVAHYYMLQKADVRLPLVYAAVLALLLGYRLVRHYLDLRVEAKQARIVPATPTKPKFWKGQLRIAHTYDETPDVRTFRLVPVEGTMLPFDYLPGQYMNLALTIDGKAVNRSYTIASSPTRLGHCELTVKREAMGTSSRHLHALGVGDLIRVSAPAGKFTFDGMTDESIVLIAGGVGITPLMSKIRFLTDLAWKGEIFLIFSARSEQDIIFRDELQYLADRNPNLHVTITLTRASEAWQGERGRVSAELLQRVVPSLTGRCVHICGPTEMTDATRATLISIGVPANRIEVESFTSPKGSGSSTSNVPVANGTAHTLTFARSSKTVEIAADQTLLDAAEVAGVEIDSDCRSGICGTCKTRLIGGTVAMDADDALTAGDRAKGLVLACQARCTADAEIDA